MRRQKWAMGCASLDRQRWRSEGMRRPKWAMVVRRGDAPAKWSNTKSVSWQRMRRQTKRPNRRGMRRPSEKMPNRWRLGGECARQMKQHQIGGGSAGNVPAKTEQHQICGGSAGNAPAKRNNTKSVAARRGMRRPNGPTPNRWWLGGECIRLQKKGNGGAAMGVASRPRPRLRLGHAAAFPGPCFRDSSLCPRSSTAAPARPSSLSGLAISESGVG